MKIKLLVTSGNFNMYKDYLSKYKYKEEIIYSDWFEPDWLHKEKYRLTYIKATIEINSIEELFEMTKYLPTNNHEIIINNDINDEDSPYIEIYDNWRET